MVLTEEMLKMIQEIVLMPVFFILTAWIFKLVWDGKRNRLKNSIHHKLVEKFSNGGELSNFLQTGPGSDFLKALNIDGLTQHERLLSFLSRGIIALCLGAGLLLLGAIYSAVSRLFYSLGVVILMTGIGHLIYAAVSLKLSKKWGMLKDEDER
ncbi:MAG: hypothetical protein GY765_27920 [bacterium]|nr:hypothetical protein [bacterium]